MPKPIRRSDRQNRDFLRRFFASKRGQEYLRGQQVEADTPFPGVQLLPEAPIYGTPTQYEEADLGKAALLALREGAGMVPIVGEALDVAEFEKIRRTGKDFYEDEADPTMYAGLTAAGMLLPNIIERPARAIGRAAKKFFKFGKKSEGEFDAFTEGLNEPRRTPKEPVTTKKPEPLIDVLREPDFRAGSTVSLPVMDSSGNFVDAHHMKVRVPDPEDTKGLPVLSDQSGVQFVRDWYSDPKVQKHFRDVAGSKYTGADRRVFEDAFDDYSNMYDQSAGIYKDTDWATEGAPEIWTSKNPEIQKVLDKITAIEQSLPGKGLDYYDIPVETPMSEADRQKIGKLWDQVRSKQVEISEQLVKDLEKKYGKNVIDALRRSFEGPWPTGFILDGSKINETGTALERVFLRGRTTPDILADFENKDLRKIVPEDAGGVSDGRVTAIIALDDTGMETINRSAFSKEWERLTGAHEANHEATVPFLRGRSPEAQTIRDGLSLAVKPEFQNLVKNGWHRKISDGDEYYASVAELTARAMEMRMNLIKTVKSYSAGNLQGMSKNAILRARQISDAFGGKMPSEEQVFKFVTGDHEGFTLAQKNSMLGASLGDVKDTLMTVYNKVLAGEPGPNIAVEKLESFRNLMKYGLLATGAAGAYGAMDNQGQAPTGMARGGMIAMKKKRGGMSVIRK